MNEIITNEAPEIMETAIETAAKYGPKHVAIGFLVGLGTGIAGTRIAKNVKAMFQDRKAQRNEARFHRIKENTEDDVQEVATDD